MAMFDWNGDGKKDLLDNMIEYEGYRQFTSSNDGNTPQKDTAPNAQKSSGGGDISIFGVIAIVIVSMLGSGWVCMTFNIESGIVIIILWLFFAFALFAAVSAIKGR